MKYTENYNFLLPDGTDKVNIENVNKNFSDIDGYLAENQTAITELNKQVVNGGKGTLVYQVADNTSRLDELEENGSTGGVTPALYVKRATSETVDNITWHIEKWNDGYARCWCDVVVESLNFSTVGATGNNIGFVLVPLPTSLFPRKPSFVSVSINVENSSGLCNANVTSLDENFVALVVHRTDDQPAVAMNNVHFCIEVRGDVSLG
jgi:hypothetical protein